MSKYRRVRFLPRDAMHKRGYSRYRCPSVRLSRSWIMPKRINISSKFFSPSGSHTILVFPYQRGCRYSDGNPLKDASNAGGVGKKRDSGRISGCIEHHRLRGSASTVLTATSQVNGRWWILTPHRIETHEPTATKFRTIDYVRGRTP